ncbi:galactokinase gal [Agrocybe pediades]|nr:galactokinase gal [Agrocybe pediades]
MSTLSIANQPIPVYTNLRDVFGSVEASLPHAVRWNTLVEEFEKRFGRKPAYIARAPGRVNLIGEHIDYSLFGVLPAAVDRDILIACAPRSVAPEEHQAHLDEHKPGGVIAQNLHPKYTPQIFAPAPKAKVPATDEIKECDVHAESWYLDINKRELRWESYVKAGYYGVLNHHFTGGGSALPTPVDLLVTGSVPAGSGLSSSAAMVVASTLAFLAVNGKLEPENAESHLDKGTLVKLAVENEKRVGVNSGGMDQASSVMSDPSSALYITFFPSLTASTVHLPGSASFVIANSLVVSDKVVSAKRHYNLRVVETLVGARVLANALGVRVGEREKVTFREVVGRFAGEEEGVDMGPEELESVLQSLEGRLGVLKRDDGIEEGVTMDEMVRMSGLSKEVFEEVYLSWVEIETTHFQLYKRAKHVFTEARRVLQFRKTCLDVSSSSSSSSSSEAECIERLGRLMNESQQSCNEDFDCSCPELNELTRLAGEAGALGSRLTGAGWGGCTVSLVPEDKVESFIDQVKKTYPVYQGMNEQQLGEAIFATKPGSGACVFKVED